MKLRRIPIKGWKRCVHEAASFESSGEFKAACLLDDCSEIEWWLRNDPPLMRIPTPAGYFEPDFIYKATGTKSSRGMGALEIKGEVFWDGAGSVPRIKAAAACAWAQATHTAGTAWEFSVVLEQDALQSTTFEDLRQVAREHYP